MASTKKRKVAKKSVSGAQVYRSPSRQREIVNRSPGMDTPTEKRMGQALTKARQAGKITPARAGTARANIFIDSADYRAKQRNKKKK